MNSLPDTGGVLQKGTSPTGSLMYCYVRTSSQVRPRCRVCRRVDGAGLYRACQMVGNGRNGSAGCVPSRAAIEGAACVRT
jgi:hypothetical protein